MAAAQGAGHARRCPRTPGEAWTGWGTSGLESPATQGSQIGNGNGVASDKETKTITFVDPTTPAYFEVVVDTHTLLPREVRMTAAAHFMVDRYIRFNAPRAIYPPR